MDKLEKMKTKFKLDFENETNPTSFSLHDVKWLIEQTEKLEEVKTEIEERLRNANNLDEYDVVFELENILETLK